MAGKKKTALKWQANNKALANSRGKELQASKQLRIPVMRCPAKGIGPPPALLGKLLTSIVSRLTMPKLHLATLGPFIRGKIRRVLHKTHLK